MYLFIVFYNTPAASLLLGGGLSLMSFSLIFISYKTGLTQWAGVTSFCYSDKMQNRFLYIVATRQSLLLSFALRCRRQPT